MMSTLPKPTPFLPLPRISTALPSSSARLLDCFEDGSSERARMGQNLVEPPAPTDSRGGGLVICSAPGPLVLRCEWVNFQKGDT